MTMPTEPLYFDAPLCLEFEAEVIETFSLPDGRTGVILPRTYFYPTSGGQEHDTGTIGPAQVIDVYKDDQGRIVHSLSLPLTIGRYPARIDRDRRLRAMQHHTAQHVLTGSFVAVIGLETLSANINGCTPSTIDLDAGQISAPDLARVEAYANQIVFENRTVKSYYVTEAEAAQIPFRKPPAVSGRIRVIEVDGFDYSACGGTHCPQTGMIGLVKILRTERVNQKLRVHFVAGAQALEVFQACHTVMQEISSLLDTGLEGLTEAVRRQQERLKSIEVELEGLRQERLEYEARLLAESARPVERWRLVTAIFPNRPPAELRLLAGKLRAFPGLVSLLASYDGQKLSLVAACAPDSGLDARLLLASHLTPLACRGGGDETLAQGGGPVEQSALSHLFLQTEEYIRQMQPSTG